MQDYAHHITTTPPDFPTFLLPWVVDLVFKTCSIQVNISISTQIIIRQTILNHTHATTYQKRTNGHEIRFIQKWGDLPGAHKAKILPMASLPLLHELALAKKKLVKEMCSDLF